MKIPTRVLTAVVVACGAPALAVGAVALAHGTPATDSTGEARSMRLTVADSPAAQKPAASGLAPRARSSATAPLDPADEVRRLDTLTADAGRQAHRVAGERAMAAAAAKAAKAAADAVAAKAQAEHQLAVELASRSGVNWDAIARCETGGNWSMQGSRYSGGVGFYNGTWSSFGGHEFAPNAGMATRDQQIIVAQRVWDRHGLSGWGCKRFG